MHKTSIPPRPARGAPRRGPEQGSSQESRESQSKFPTIALSPSRIDIFEIRSSTEFPNRQPNYPQPRAARLPNAVALGADICIFHNYIAIAQRTKPNPCFWEIKFAVDSGYAIILCCPPGRLVQKISFAKLNSPLTAVSLLSAWAVDHHFFLSPSAAHAESISARIRGLNNQSGVFRSQKGVCHAPFLAGVSRYGSAFAFASLLFC